MIPGDFSCLFCSIWKKHTHKHHISSIRVIMLRVFLGQSRLPNLASQHTWTNPMKRCLCKIIEASVSLSAWKSNITPSNKGNFRSNRNRREIHVMRWWMFSYHSRDVFTLHLFNWLKNNHLNWIEKVDMGKHLPQTLRAAFFPLARKTYQNCVNAGRWEVKLETS